MNEVGCRLSPVLPCMSVCLQNKKLSIQTRLHQTEDSLLSLSGQEFSKDGMKSTQPLKLMWASSTDVIKN